MELGKATQSAVWGAGLLGFAGLVMAGPLGLITGMIVGGLVSFTWTLYISTANMPDIPAVHIDRRETWHCQEADGEMVSTPLVPTGIPGDIFLQDLNDLKQLLEKRDSSQQIGQLLSQVNELINYFQTMQSTKNQQEKTEIFQKLRSLWGKKISIQLASMADQNEEIRILRNEIRITMDQLQKAG